MQTIGEKMAFMNLDDTELIGLFGIVLFDPHAKKLTRETQQILSKCRSQLFNDLYNYYEYNNIIEPQVRLGNLILLLQGVKVSLFVWKYFLKICLSFVFLDTCYEVSRKHSTIAIFQSCSNESIVWRDYTFNGSMLIY